jgi:Ser/Thr protein kinase RdoA (MazF antagonist)
MVHVVDFEWSGLDVWVADLARLHLGIWATRPDLRRAFLSGYGRDLDEGDRAMLHGCAVLTAVWLVVKAHETRQPSFEDASRAALLRLIDGAA